MSDDLVNGWLVKAEEAYRYNKARRNVGQNSIGV